MNSIGASCVACLPAALLERKFDGMLQLFSLDSYKLAPISSYSKGMRQKIPIIGALLHNPQIPIFDEPISGQDITAALIFRELLADLSRTGKIVLCSSHQLALVESVCAEVVILHYGKVHGAGGRGSPGGRGSARVCAAVGTGNRRRACSLLLLLSPIMIEALLWRLEKLPFTCSYAPGKGPVVALLCGYWRAQSWKACCGL